MLQNVLVYQYPFEFPNESVSSFLDKFGAVKNVSHQHWTNLPDVCTGTRIVCMVVEKDIPRSIFVRGIRCKVWYRDQPLTCDICSKGGHKAYACPDKGECLRCHSPGHVACHCPTPWGGAGGSNNVATAASESGAAGAGAVRDVPPVLVDPQSVLPAGVLLKVFSMLMILMLVSLSLLLVICLRGFWLLLPVSLRWSSIPLVCSLIIPLFLRWLS